jgi:beta-aspartyl-peptidase (threonine type)
LTRTALKAILLYLEIAVKITVKRPLFWCILILTPIVSMAADEIAVPRVVLGIHGGVGVKKKEMTPELERHVRAGLEMALNEGYARLQKPGATSLDAVETAIRVLEDDPRFNAGKGAVFTRDGRNELDASIMEGRTKKAGAVAGVTVIKNPISAARAVMEKTKHVMLIGQGADVFARDAGLEIVDPKYFWTEARWKQLQEEAGYEWSTVGAVSVDAAGNLAAGTSTGGMSNKQYGRIGDSPIIGAGTYADNRSCAVSGTGHGEYFIRYAVSHDIAVLMEYKGISVQQAADDVIRRKLKEAGGEGAAIALDAQGNFAMSHNTEGLYRGYVTSDGNMKVMLFEN